MNWKLLPKRIIQAVMLEIRCLNTSNCGLNYAVRKWVAVLGNQRKIKFLGNNFYYEDRLNPFSIFDYVNEINDLFLLMKNEKKGLNILDIGANIGIWSRALLGADHDATIYSFEPNEKPYKLLEKNSSNYPSWKIFNFGIGPVEQEIDFYYVDCKSGQGSIYRENANLEIIGGGEVVKTSVKIRPLSSQFIKENFKKNEFDIVKIDVEGYESEVLDAIKLVRWNFLYIEISANRAATAKFEEIKSKIENYWSNAKLVKYKDKGASGDAYFVCQ